MGSRKRAQQRIAEIRARNPGALPAWLGRSQEKAWDRVSWQTDGGVKAEDAARPALLMLGWLARRGLLTSAGITALRAGESGTVAELALTPSLVLPKAAAFLDRYWESWWETCGINLAISADLTDRALAEIEEYWRQFGVEKAEN
jgi:hypothetical protein